MTTTSTVCTRLEVGVGPLCAIVHKKTRYTKKHGITFDMPSDKDEAGDTGRKRRDKVRTVTDRRSTRLNVASTHLCNSRDER
jgi:hypothetical protein